MAAVTFRDLIARNQRDSWLLVAGFVLFVACVALVLSLAMLAWLAPQSVAELDWQRGLLIGLAAGGVAFALSLLGYFSGAAMILGVSGAHELEPGADPELRNIVEEMAIAAGVPCPRIYVIDDPAPNAFATGRDPRHGVVAITTGLRQMLTRDELQGVIAHEMAHIRNYDIRLMLLLAVLIGTTVMLSDFFFQALRSGVHWGGTDSRGGRGKRDGAGGFVIILILVAVLLSIIAPILAQIIQLAVSRQREYLADASAVELTRNPLGLANALRKLGESRTPLSTANRGTAHLFIVNPIPAFGAMAETVFASHPPLAERIRRLLSLAREPVAS